MLTGHIPGQLIDADMGKVSLDQPGIQHKALSQKKRTGRGRKEKEKEFLMGASHGHSRSAINYR